MEESEAEEDPFAGYTAIGPVGSERKIRDWSLVLQSASIWHATRRTLHGWFIFVRGEDGARATASIDRYEEENRDWPPRQTRERPAYDRTALAPILFLALIAFFTVTGPAARDGRFFQHGVAISDLVVSRAPWQAVTALTLHADAPHVIGNAISGTVFGAAVMRRLGPGGGALAILASGFLGNFANALYHHAMGQGDHASLGASTAVFGAIGVLAATQLVLDRPEKKERRSIVELIAPIIGGLALLGTLGSGGANTDLGAHLFGFLGGILVGLFACLPLRTRRAIDLASFQTHVAFAETRWWIQPLLGAIAGGVVVGSWAIALRR